MSDQPLDPEPYRVQDYLMYWLGRASKPDYNAKARYIFEPREGYSQNERDYE